MGTRRRKQRRYNRDGYTLQWREGVPVACWSEEGTGKRRRVRLAESTTSFAQGQKLLDQFAESSRAVSQHQAKHTIGTLWALWLKDRAADGLSNDIHTANWTSLKPHFEHRSPEHLTVDDCRAYAQSRFDEGRAASTVHTELSRLRTCLKWAHSRRLVDVLAHVWVPGPSKPRNRVLTQIELQNLIAGAEKGDPHVHLFVVLLISTGARHKAVLDLTWDRVDFRGRTIMLEENIKADPMSRSWRKGRATVPMPQLAYDALQIAYAGRQTAYVIEHGGKRLKSVRAGFDAAAERAGIQGKCTPHTIRHTMATLLRESGLANDVIARVLGHSDQRTTDLIYTHTGVDFIRPAAGLIDAILGSTQETRH
jgi:integrase